METQIHRYQRLKPFLSNSSYIHQDLSSTDVSAHVYAGFCVAVKVQGAPMHACLEMCACMSYQWVRAYGSTICPFSQKAGSVKASGRLKYVYMHSSIS